MCNDGLEAERKRKIIGILQVMFPQVKIYLYGSRAKGTFHDRSDIDLAIDAGKKVSLEVARDAVAAVAMPYKIDLVDLNLISPDFKEEILKDAIRWS